MILPGCLEHFAKCLEQLGYRPGNSEGLAVLSLQLVDNWGT